VVERCPAGGIGGVDVGTGCQQIGDDLFMSAKRRHCQGCHLLRASLQLQLGAVFEQKSDEFPVPLARGRGEWQPTHRRWAQIGIGAGGEQSARHRDAADLAGRQQGRRSMGIEPVDRDPGLEQQSDYLCIAACCPGHQLVLVDGDSSPLQLGLGAKTAGGEHDHQRQQVQAGRHPPGP
jgi:hypothetical protein